MIDTSGGHDRRGGCSLGYSSAEPIVGEVKEILEEILKGYDDLISERLSRTDQYPSKARFLFALLASVVRPDAWHTSHRQEMTSETQSNYVPYNSPAKRSPDGIIH